MSNKEIKATITADNKQFKRGIDESKKEVGGFEGSINKLKKSLGVLAGAAAIGAVVKGLFNMAKEVANNADRLLDLETQTGLTTDQIQEFEHVSRVAGVSTDAFANASMGLTQRLARARGEASPLNVALRELGVEINDSAGNMRNGAVIMDDVIEQLIDMENQTQRNVMAQQIFGGAWRDLAPILEMGKDGIDAAKQEARDLGLVMGKDALNAANDFRIEMERMNAQWTVLKREVGMAVIPMFTNLIDLLGQAYHGWRRMLGLSSPSDALRTGNQLADEFLQSIDNITDAEERRSEIIKEIISLESKYGELLASNEKDVQKIGETMREQRDILRDNFDHYATIKQKEIDQATEAAEKEQEVIRQTEAERRSALGEIGRLEEDLSEAKIRFNTAESDADRVRHHKAITNIEKEIELIKQRAALLAGRGAAPGASVEGMPSTIMAPRIDTAHEQFIENMKDQRIELRQTQSEAEKLTESYENMEHAITNAALGVGTAMSQMASDTEKSTNQIVQQLLRQVTGILINQIMISLPFPANIAAATGASSISGGLFTFADGGIVSGPTIGLVGEYAGARSNPEVIAPLDKLQGMLGAGLNQKVEFIIKGNTLYGVLGKEQNKRNQIGSK